MNRYSLLSGKTNQATAMSLSPDKKIVVAGSSMNASNNLDYLLIKYSADGTQDWLSRYDSTNANDQLRGMALDVAP